jgi:Cupredoxin-like domain
MLRRRLAVLLPTLAGLMLVVSGCTLPTSDNGSGYGPEKTGGQLIKTKPKPAPTPLKSGVPALLRAHDSSWAPGNYVVSQRATIELKVVNTDQTQHTFTLQGGSVSKIIPSGGQTLVKFAAPGPGKLRFYCKYQQQEMQGWITVT